MKQQKSKQKQGKLQKSIAECGIRDVRLPHTSKKKPLWMPELKETGGKRRLQRNSDEFRRKTRSQALSEKQVQAVSSSLNFSEVSIETLHSICAPAASQQANKNLQIQQPNKSTSRSTDQLGKIGIAPYGLLLSSKQNLFHTSQAHLPEENGLQDESHSTKSKAEKSSYSSTLADILPLEDTWLEVFVEVEDGIDLVVDLDSMSIADWFMDRNSCTVVHPHVADESQKQCGTDSHPDGHLEGACFGSNDIETPSTNTTAHNNNLITFCIAADGDAGSQTAQMGILAGCIPSCKLVEVIDSQESFNSEVKGLGFNFGSLERMPTFFATGMRRPSAEASKVTCNSNRMVVCIGA